MLTKLSLVSPKCIHKTLGTWIDDSFICVNNLKMQLQVGKIDVLIEAYSALCQTMQLFAKIVNGLQSLTIFTKSFILDVWQGTEYANVESCAEFTES